MALLRSSEGMKDSFWRLFSWPSFASFRLGPHWSCIPALTSQIPLHMSTLDPRISLSTFSHSFWVIYITPLISIPSSHWTCYSQIWLESFFSWLTPSHISLSILAGLPSCPLLIALTWLNGDQESWLRCFWLATLQGHEPSVHSFTPSKEGVVWCDVVWCWCLCVCVCVTMPYTYGGITSLCLKTWVIVVEIVR